MLGNKPDSMREKAKQRFREKREALYDSLFNEYARQRGAFKIMEQIDLAEQNIEERKRALAAIGFHIGNYDDRLHLDDKDTVVEDLIEKKVVKELGREHDIDARFDSVQIAIMTVATPEEAEKLMKSVSEL
jgi:hypothetical protein